MIILQFKKNIYWFQNKFIFYTFTVYFKTKPNFSIRKKNYLNWTTNQIKLLILTRKKILILVLNIFFWYIVLFFQLKLNIYLILKCILHKLYNKIKIWSSTFKLKKTTTIKFFPSELFL